MLHFSNGNVFIGLLLLPNYLDRYFFFFNAKKAVCGFLSDFPDT